LASVKTGYELRVHNIGSPV